MKRIIGIIFAAFLSNAAFAQDVINPQTNASALATGVVPSARGGAGTITGVLKGNGAGVVSQGGCTDLSNGGCSNSGPNDFTFGAIAKGLAFNGINSSKWGSGQVTLTAGGSMGVTAFAGLVVYSNNTSGGSAVVLCDSGSAVVTIIGQSNAGQYVTADPGAGTSKIWVKTNCDATNRYATSQNIAYSLIATTLGTLQ